MSLGIPTCVGNTGTRQGRKRYLTVHPHMRGEHRTDKEMRHGY